MIRTLCALALTAAGALALALAAIVDRPRPGTRTRNQSAGAASVGSSCPRDGGSRPAEAGQRAHRSTVISPVGRAIALDVAAYRFVRGGDA